MGFNWREKSLEDIVTCARYAEQVGVESVWVSEAWGREAFLALGAIASATNRVKLGTGIVNVFSRSPATLAMSAATLDELSNGRAILGLGSSGLGVVERWHGLHYEKPVTRVREAINIVQQALSGSQVNLQGRVFQVSDFTLATEQPKRRIPIYVAALGPKMLRLAGEIADGVLFYLNPLTNIPAAIDELRKGAQDVQRPFESIDAAVMLPTYVSDNREQAQYSIAKTIAYYIGGMGTYYHRTISESGFQSEAKMIREAWQRGDRIAATRAVSKELIDSVALAGPRDYCRRRLREFRDAGITLPIITFQIQDQGGPRSVCESIKILAEN